MIETIKKKRNIEYLGIGNREHPISICHSCSQLPQFQQNIQNKGTNNFFIKLTSIISFFSLVWWFKLRDSRCVVDIEFLERVASSFVVKEWEEGTTLPITTSSWFLKILILISLTVFNHNLVNYKVSFFTWQDIWFGSHLSDALHHSSHWLGGGFPWWRSWGTTLTINEWMIKSWMMIKTNNLII